MNHTFPGDPFPLAQMPTDQRELEHHRWVQTGPPDNGMFQVKPSQSCNQCPPSEDWQAFRPAPQSMNAYHHSGYRASLRVNESEPYGLSRILSGYGPGSYLSPTEIGAHAMTSMASSPTMMSSPVMGLPCPSNLKQEGSEELTDWSPASQWIRSQPSHSAYQQDHRLKVEESDKSNHHIKPTPRMSPSPISIPSYHSTPQPSPAARNMKSYNKNIGSPPTPSEDGGSEDDNHTDPPYSQLIFQALNEQEEKRLPLQKIYEWFEKNTAKGRDQGQKGWQNSIRHNLSMNAGFVAVREEGPEGKRSTNYWCLTKEAIQNGIQSTTRYRRDIKGRKTSAFTEPMSSYRGDSGIRSGGRRPANKPRHLHYEDRPRSPFHHPGTVPGRIQPRPMTTNGLLPYEHAQVYSGPSLDTSNMAWHPHPYLNSLPLNQVVGCATPPHFPDHMAHYHDNSDIGGSRYCYQ